MKGRKDKMMVYCRGCLREIPDEELLHEEGGGIANPPIHYRHVLIKHFVLTGMPTDIPTTRLESLSIIEPPTTRLESLSIIEPPTTRLESLSIIEPSTIKLRGLSSRKSGSTPAPASKLETSRLRRAASGKGARSNER